MITFKTFITEVKERKIGKGTPSDFYVHKDYVDQTHIPKDVHDNALKVLKKHYPDFHHTLVKYNKNTNDISFLHSPDFDSSTEPLVGKSVKISPSGEHKLRNPGQSAQIYHQKDLMVGDDYKGFDVAKSKKRTEDYKKAVQHVANSTGQSTGDINRKTGWKSYWDKEIVPHIKE